MVTFTAQTGRVERSLDPHAEAGFPSVALNVFIIQIDKQSKVKQSLAKLGNSSTNKQTDPLQDEQTED